MEPKRRAGHELTLRVYWEDTDAGGRVYYANYLKFAERARTELLRAAGVQQSALYDESGTAFVVTHCSIDYLAAARLDDILTVRTMLAALRGASLAMHQAVFRGDIKMADLQVDLACLDSHGRPIRIPPPIRRALEEITAAS